MLTASMDPTKCLADRKRTNVSIPWPVPSAQTLLRLEQRSPVFKCWTESYTSLVTRMSFLMDIPPPQRIQKFEQCCLERNLLPTTAHAYWTAFLTTKTALGEIPTMEDKRFAKLLLQRSSVFPAAHPMPAELHHVEKMVRDFPKKMGLLCALAFSLGQRLGDVLQLAKHDIQIDQQFILITVRRGKVVPHIGPYVLTMERNFWLSRELWNLREQTTSQFLWTENNSTKERELLELQLRRMITAVDPRLEIRSLRRGGLQRMAASGFPMDTVILFSKHKTTQMLLRYLNWGAASYHRNVQMANVVSSVSQYVTCAL